MALKKLKGSIRFDRNELSGSFGDIGTDLPLIVGMIMASGLDIASTFIMFGVMQIFTGIMYGIPMPVQPLKAMAVIMISQKLNGNLLYGGGLAIGITMLVLTLTGLLEWIARIIPKSVIRGVQFGLGISLATLALKDYVQSDGIRGYVLASVGFVMILFFLGNKKYPAALSLILLGAIYAFIFKMDFFKIGNNVGLTLPQFHIPGMRDVLQGFILLTLPQIALSISNSVIATRQTMTDLFPERLVSVKKIGLTYSFMNLILPFFKGIPNCHGAGGMAGHYAFGARTGGAVIIYGSLYLLIGLFFARGFEEVIKVFPFPILGIILLFEGLTLMLFIKDIADSKKDIFVALLVALMAVGLPNGYVVGLIAGALMAYGINKGIIIKSSGL